MGDPQNRLEESNGTWIRAVVESLRDVVWVHDIDGTITYCSPSGTAALSRSPEELRGTNEQDLIHPLDRAARRAVIEQLRATGAPQPPVDIRLRNRNGSYTWFEVTDTDLLNDPVVHSLVTSARDVSARKAAAEELIDLSLRDALTGLPNRASLMDRLGVALARTARTDLVLAVLFCDLDEFKAINDTLGHEAGDRVLKQVANRLQIERRRSDTVARIGGDEFVIVCEGLSGYDDATEMATQIRDAVEQPMELGETPTPVSVSIGIVVVEGAAARGMEATTLLSNADAAMYCAKRQGKARWHVFDDALIEEATYQSALHAELRSALERREFVVHYQPIFDLEHHTVAGAEAILRWNHPSRGLLHPDQFMAVAEQSGCLAGIGEWVLAEACAQQRRWEHELGFPDWISVSVSARQVLEPGLAATISEILTLTDLSPDHLWLGLSETALLRAGRSASVELRAVEALGVHLGMEDFGVGNASPTNLQRLPIDFFKIGPGFVADLDATIGRDVDGNAIVSALIELGRGLKLRTVAAGIERDGELKLVREFGCRYGQGRLLGRPMTSAEFTRLLVAPRHPSQQISRVAPSNVAMLYGLPRPRIDKATS